jgi:hypothetical protein
LPATRQDFRNDIGRRAMLALFDMLGSEHELTRRFRARLAELAGLMQNWHTHFAVQPAFAPLRPWIDRLAERPAGLVLSLLNDFAQERQLLTASGLPVRFVKQDSPCGQLEYESSIYASGCVPSRERNWHDLFNALIWLAYPATKAALNSVHQFTLRAGDNRLPASDAATLFDESGLVLVGEDPALARLLAQRRWHEALVAQRSCWANTRVYVIGHAVLEKLVCPWPGITAKCLFLEMPPDSPPEMIDQAIAQHWRPAATLTPAELFPLPVLGIPGWWQANEDCKFYEDQRYFRPLRQT